MAGSLTFETVPDRLVERVPELFDTYADNDEKFGGNPYTFMMLASAWIRQLALAAASSEVEREAAGPVLLRVFGFIEQGLRSENQRVTDLVATGFLEGLDPTADYYRILEQYMGPATRREKARQVRG